MPSPVAMREGRLSAGALIVAPTPWPVHAPAIAPSTNPVGSWQNSRSPLRPKRTENPLRLETKFPSNLKVIWVVQMAKQKYSAFQNAQIGP
jgi:hypothetical protein